MIVVVIRDSDQTISEKSDHDYLEEEHMQRSHPVSQSIGFYLQHEMSMSEQRRIPMYCLNSFVPLMYLIG